MNTAVGVALFAMALPIHAIEEACELDRVFESQGRIVHSPDEFNEALQVVLHRIRSEIGLGPATNNPVYNKELDKFIVRVAFDLVSTPTDKMVDDLVLYADEDSRTFCACARRQISLKRECTSAQARQNTVLVRQ